MAFKFPDIFGGREELTEDFGEHIDDGSPHKIENILLVGSPNNYTYDTFQDGPDHRYLKSSLKGLSEEGVNLSSEFEITTIDLENGDDFLTDPHKADLVVLCNIYSPGSESRSGFFQNRSGTYLSKNHFNENAWGDAVDQTGAKYLAVTPADGNSLTEITFNDVDGAETKFEKRKTVYSGFSDIDIAFRK